MTKTLCVLVVIVLCNTICQSASIAEEKPTDIRNKRTAAKIGDLRVKLEKLKKLLDDMDTENTDQQTTPAPEKPKSEESHSEEQNSEKGEKTLSPKDILLLKSLKLALQGMHKEETVDKKQDMGHFYEVPLNELGDQTDAKRTLHDKFYLQDPANSFRQAQDGIPAKRTNSETFANTKSGHFEDFSDNVLQTVVYRLLSDLDLALRNGVSVEDIIKYLYETEQAARQTQKRSRIEDEEKQLKALLNQEPSPRD